MVNMSDFSILFKQAMDANGMNALVSEQATQAFYALTERMLQVNSVMNLTAITEPGEIILRHYVDSLMLLPHLPQGARVLDVGCGAGFPSLPLAIARPDLNITALDSTEKKIRYVAETARLLGIGEDRFSAISARAEDVGAPGAPMREQFDVVVSRAVARLSVLDELCLPFLRPGGLLLAMKGARASEEAEEASSGIRLLGGEAPLLVDCTLHSPLGGEPEHHALVIIKKCGKTPKIYPRKYAQILKKPL